LWRHKLVSVQSSPEAQKKFLSDIEEILKSSDAGDVSLIPEFASSKLNFRERLANYVTTLVGSWKFTVGLIVLMACWFIINSIAIFAFDPFPFIFLNLFLSSIAALQAPVILMAANAQYRRDLERDVYHQRIAVVSEAEQRASYRKLVNVEVDLSMSNEEAEYTQATMRHRLAEIVEDHKKLMDAIYEYKDRVDKIGDDVILLRKTCEEIHDGHVELMGSMIEQLAKRGDK
jgi:uncharacterized membrane protein